ncbi:DUF952 domain-containing protein [Myceligenerans halotolerans]
MDQTIWHIALREDWEAAESSGVYTVSTRGRSVAEVGFLHASFDVDQVRRVAAAFYADSVPLAILEISMAALRAAGIDVRSEPADPADPDSERFPHVYGTVPATAVLRVVPAWVPDGELVAPRLVDRAVWHERP